jgi:hypothetical protein
LLEIQRQDYFFQAEQNISCKLDSQSRITQNPPRKFRKKKKRQILPPCLPQTQEPIKTDQTQHFPTNGPTAKTRRDVPALIWTTELVSEVQTQLRPNSEHIIVRSVLTKIPPPEPKVSTPSPPPQPVQTDQARHIPSKPTLKPRRDAIELIRTGLDPSCPQTSPGETTTLPPPSAMEPT